MPPGLFRRLHLSGHIQRSQRHRTFKGGSISHTGGASTDCIIRNLSDTGACLEVVNSVGIPDNFELIIRPEILTRSCEVAWRTGLRIGVRFKGSKQGGLFKIVMRVPEEF